MANQFANTGSATAAVAILKNWYQGAVVSQFNDDIPFYREIDKGKEKFAGLQVIRNVKVRRNQGIGATSDGGALPSIGVQTTQQAQIPAKYNYLRFGLTGPMLKSASGDKAAFANIMEFEMSEGMNDLKSDVNRQIFWDGTATLATVSANAVASNVVSCTGRESAEAGNKFLDVGMIVDIVSGGVVIASGLVINALSGTTTATLTLSQQVTTSTNDLIIRTGSLSQEVQGILYTLDGGTTTIYNIDRSAYPSYQGNVITGSSGQITLNLLQQTYNEARRRGNGKPRLFYCDFDTERFYTKTLVSDKRYIGKVAGDGTFSSKDGSYLEFAGNPVVPDKDCPQRMLMLDPATWKKYVLAELDWADETGSYMIAQSGVDAWEVRLRLFMNLFCEKPSANAALKSYVSP